MDCRDVCHYSGTALRVGVHIEGRVAEVLQDGADHVSHVVLNDGQRLQADLCGLHGLSGGFVVWMTGAGWNRPIRSFVV
jgi:hypothetical protein